MELAKKIYNFLIPQYAVAEVFLAAILYFINPVDRPAPHPNQPGFHFYS